MRHFYKDGSWFEDKRTYGISNESRNDFERRQIDSIQKKYPCSVSNAFLMLGIYFNCGIGYEVKKRDFKSKSQVLEFVQNKANLDRRKYYLLLFDDSSLVIYKNSKIILFTVESELYLTQNLIQKKIDKMGSNAGIKSIMFSPD